ncbi:uncharacterized protein LOC122855339 [Aphidius gifuensis]|uniref:uncharacterized protein LOC122855339 n=1 Tax=Aphidius gifuensis TaxID=684658 RepID=UPI001CDB76AB|nr:uncharacterized protein LOC122855339 [Aphidius gifuensis]
MKFLIVILSALIAGISSQIVVPTYPLVKSLPTCDLEKLVGTWYTWSAIPNGYEPSQKCSTVEVVLNKEGGFSATVSYISILTGSTNKFNFSAYPIQGSRSQFDLKFQPLALERNSVGIILDTDYIHFYVLEMIQMAEDGSMLQYAWVLSKNATLDAQSCDRADHALELNGISKTSLKRVSRYGCSLY